MLNKKRIKELRYCCEQFREACDKLNNAMSKKVEIVPMDALAEIIDRVPLEKEI